MELLYQKLILLHHFSTSQNQRKQVPFKVVLTAAQIDKHKLSRKDKTGIQVNCKQMEMILIKSHFKHDRLIISLFCGDGSFLLSG